MTNASDYAKIFRAAANGCSLPNRWQGSSSSYDSIMMTRGVFNSIAEVFENIAKAEQPTTPHKEPE